MASPISCSTAVRSRSAAQRLLAAVRRGCHCETLERRMLLSLAPAGAEFRANTFTTNAQSVPAVAADADGDLVVVWQSNLQDGSGNGVYAQRYNAAGVAQGAEFRVNTTTISAQFDPAVAMDADGDFVVAWTGNGSGDSAGIFAQRYNASGVAQGGEFRVNTFTANGEAAPAAAIGAAGDFVVTWESNLQDGSGYGIYAQRYNASGTAQGGEFRVNTFTTGAQRFPAAAMDAAGDFVLAWASNGQDGSSYGVYAQRYNPLGVALGGEFLVNIVTTGSQNSPALAMDAAGDFVLTWESGSIFAQRYNSSGVAQGSEFRVNTFTTGSTFFSSVAMDADGDFLVTWTSTSQDGSSNGIYAQSISAAGVAQGSEFRVNTFTTNAQARPAAAMDADGNAVVVWQSNGQDGSGYGVYAQRYDESNPDTAAPMVGGLFVGGVPVAHGQRLQAPVVGPFILSFSEDMSVAGGTSGPNSASNPANYRLVRNGVDVSSQIASAAFTFNATSRRFETTLVLSSPLAGGSHFLSARDTLRDLAGNSLDGNFDGAAGGDFTRGFLVIPQEFRVNTFTTDSQFNPTVAMDADGDFVVAWTSVNGAPNNDIFAQRYNASGVPQGSEFRVNTFTTDPQFNPTVAMDADGDFVVVWESGMISTANTFAQRYNASGVPQGSEFRVNTFTTGGFDPAVAMDADGDFVIAWSSLRVGEFGVFAQRYNAAGMALGGEFPISTTPTHFLLALSIGMDADGDFAVAWNSEDQDGSGHGVFAQRFSAAGVAQGGEFRVNTFTTDGQNLPAVAMDASGDFVVTWMSRFQDGSNYGVYAQRYNAAGVAQGAEFRVNTFTTGDQGSPSVAMDADGDFVIAWQSQGQETPAEPFGIGIYAQRYGAAGALRGAEFRVNTFTTGNQSVPVMSMDAGGDFVVTWDSTNQDGSSSGVYAQLYFAETFGPAVLASSSLLQTPPHRLRFRFDVNVSASLGLGDLVLQNLSTPQTIPASDLSLSYDVATNTATFTYTGAASGTTGVLPDGNYRATLVAPGITTPAGASMAADHVFDFFFFADPVPVGPEFRVNTFTTNAQNNPAVAVDAEGDFVVVWKSLLQDGSSDGVYAQRYSAAGIPQGNEFRVNVFTDGAQSSPSIAMDATGDFVIVFSGADSDATGVLARRFNAAGVAQGSEFVVNTFLIGTQTSASVAMDAAGNFAVIWQGNGSGDASGVFGQRFSAAGVAQGAEFRANTFTTGAQNDPAVAMDADGDYVVAWWSTDQEAAGNNGIYAQRYDSAGVPQGGEFHVNVFTTGNQFLPSVAMDADGDFIVTWIGNGLGDNGGVFGRRFSAGGVAQADEFRVNTFTTGGQGGLFFRGASVAMDASGEFVVTWESANQDGSNYGIYAQRYNATGVAQGGEFQVNTFTIDGQTSPSVGMDATGEFVVTWESPQDLSSFGVYAQRYARSLAPDPEPAVGASSFLFETAPHRLQFTFNDNVSASLGTDDLVVENLTTMQTIPSSNFSLSYDSGTNTATFSYTGNASGISGILPDGNYRATLLAAGIMNTSGVPLAANHVFNCFFLNGDANHDGRVNLNDFNILAANFGQMNRNFTQGDFDYDTAVFLSDFNILASRFGVALGPEAFGGEPIRGINQDDEGREFLDELT